MLWFGSQYTSDNKNPVFSTARIISYLSRLNEKNFSPLAESVDKAAWFILNNQNSTGSWGPKKNKPHSIEETAQSITALALVTKKTNDPQLIQKIPPALQNAVEFLQKKQDEKTLLKPAPIGLYFAKLWYSEKLYPLIFLTEALANLKNIRLSAK
jgi:squalene-hopene/tetraprenyl-beta-curcumene cyclase